jgi:hypothetical protein
VTKKYSRRRFNALLGGTPLMLASLPARAQLSGAAKEPRSLFL